MGHDLSRIVDTLYPLSTNQRLETLNQLLQDQDLYKKLVKGAKSAKLSFTLQRPSAQPKLTALQSLQPSSSVIDSRTLDTWSNDLSIFWISPEFPLNPWNGELAGFYDGTKRVEARHGLDAIRGRFQKLFYYDLLHLLNPLAAGDKASAKVYGQLVNLIAPQSQVNQDPGIVRSDLVGWVRAGRRYDKLATTFGTAILFVLPDSLSLDFLERRLPLEDGAYRATTRPLVPWGLYAKTLDAKNVAKRLRKRTLDSYAFLTSELSLPTNTAGPAASSNLEKDSDLGLRRPSDDGRLPSFAGVVEQNERQVEAQDSAAPIDTPDIDPENETHLQHVRSGAPVPNSFRENSSLDYYIDPSFLDPAHTLEYYLNIDSSTLNFIASAIPESAPTP